MRQRLATTALNLYTNTHFRNSSDGRRLEHNLIGSEEGKVQMSVELFRRSESAIFADVGGDVVALNVERGRCYGMEKVTATVWELLSMPISADNLCERLTETYLVEPSTCRSDILELLATMESEGLVERIASS